MMRKKEIILALVLASVAVSLIGPATVSALDLKYTPPCLENVSALGFGPCSSAVPTESLLGYIDNLYRFLIGIAGILALGMIVAGAIRISVSPGSIDQQSEGKSMITSAIFGIVLVFASYLILNTVNPSLTVLKYPEAPYASSSAPLSPSSSLRMISPRTPTGGLSCDPNALPPGTDGNDQAVQDLHEVGVDIVSSGNCSNPCNGSCTSLQGIPHMVVNSLRDIANHCKVGNSSQRCVIMVTGGTEIGHQTHGPGEPAVDLRFNPALASYLKNDYANNIKQICTSSGNSQYRINCRNYNETVDHLHVIFK